MTVNDNKFYLQYYNLLKQNKSTYTIRELKLNLSLLTIVLYLDCYSYGYVVAMALLWLIKLYI